MKKIEQALNDLRQGKMIILVDDEQRENEGDLVLAAQYATPQAINFMAKEARGLICLAMAEENIQRLQLPMMTNNNQAQFGTAFTVSIEAASGVSTGISAFDRAHTIQTAINPDSQPEDIVMPGHIFPLKAKKQGVLARRGHTEGGVDLMRMAELNPSAVICEIMRDDGNMARFDDLVIFAKQHDLLIVSINDIRQYRLLHEQLIHPISQSRLPINGLGEFTIQVFKDRVEQLEYVVVQKGENFTDKPTLVRLHSSCLTGDIFGSARCDCGQQLQQSLALIAKEGGIIIYLPQEGRGIGIANKIKAYALQDQGLDTVEANQQLGFADDLREYHMAAQILHNLQVANIKLLTNNPRKVAALQLAGFSVERVAIETGSSSSNLRYLQTKRDKLGHLLSTEKKYACD